MANEDNSSLEQASTSPEGSSGNTESTRPAGLVAGSLKMGIAGLVAGLLVWQALHWTYPWFYAEEIAFKNEDMPSADELEELYLAVAAAATKNAVVLGLTMGGLAALGFALVECVSRGFALRTLALTGIAIALGAALGAVGGYLCVEFQYAYPSGAEMDPMKRTIGIQCILWATLACGVGTGLALFTGRFSLLVGTILQAVLAAVLFVLVYVPLASLVFPMDDAERTTPESSANIAVWAIGALLLMGLMLGMSRVRDKK